MAEGGSDMGFAHAGRSDDDQVGRFFEPLGVKEFQDFIPGDFRIKGPVELFEEFDSFDPGLTQQMLDSFFSRSFCSSARKRCKNTTSSLES